MMVVRQTRGAGVRKPPKEETAGRDDEAARQTLWGFGRWRLGAEVRLSAGWATVVGVVGAVCAAVEGVARTVGQSRQAEPAWRSSDRATGRVSRAARGRA